MTAYQNELARLKISVIGLSVDSPESSRKLAADLELDYRLLCDTERVVLSAWSLLNSKERGGIAFPATFVIEAGGNIVFRSLDRLMSRVNPEPLLTFLEAWQRDPAHRSENQELALQTPGLRDTVTAYYRKWFGRR